MLCPSFRCGGMAARIFLYDSTKGRKGKSLFLSGACHPQGRAVQGDHPVAQGQDLRLVAGEHHRHPQRPHPGEDPLRPPGVHAGEGLVQQVEPPRRRPGPGPGPAAGPCRRRAARGRTFSSPSSSASSSQRGASPRRARGSTSAMCCSTVRQGSRRFSWNRSVGRSGTTTVPPSTGWRPASTRSRVVLPQPEGPDRAVIPSAGSSREKRFSTAFSPKQTVIFRTDITPSAPFPAAGGRLPGPPPAGSSGR